MRTEASRTDVLRPLVWPVALTLLGVISVVCWGAPTPVLWIFVALFAVSVTAYLLGFAYCLLRSPDALRSERYLLERLAIERRFAGDETKGMIQEADVESATSGSSAREGGVKEEGL